MHRSRFQLAMPRTVRTLFHGQNVQMVTTSISVLFYWTWSWSVRLICSLTTGMFFTYHLLTLLTPPILLVSAPMHTTENSVLSFFLLRFVLRNVLSPWECLKNVQEIKIAKRGLEFTLSIQNLPYDLKKKNKCCNPPPPPSPNLKEKRNGILFLVQNRGGAGGGGQPFFFSRIELARVGKGLVALNPALYRHRICDRRADLKGQGHGFEAGVARGGLLLRWMKFFSWWSKISTRAIKSSLWARPFPY